MESPEEVHGYKWVLLSDELIAALSDTWSEAVQLKLTRQNGNIIEFIVRKPEEPDAQDV